MKIDTVVPDIMNMIDEGYKPDAKNLEEFVCSIDYAVRRQMDPDKRERDSYLRMSNLGKPDRQLYYEINGGVDKELLSADTRLKFLWGDIVEALLVYLVKESGHEVTDEQAELEIEGVLGHMDLSIDGVPTDIKSASDYGFKKFKEGTLADEGNDPFGYMAQISSYAHAKGTTKAAFLALNKNNSKLALMPVDEMDMINVPDRIKHMKEVVAQPEPPERCFEPVADGKSGNMKLNIQCSYCSFKDGCWSDVNDGVGLRLFLYGNGPRWLTTVEREPDVFEQEK